MRATSAKYVDNQCFKDNFGGFDIFKPINVIIGKNNSGKSRLLDFAELLCGDKLLPDGYAGRFTGTFTEDALRRNFYEDRRSQRLAGGDDWRYNGRLFVEKNVSWEVTQSGEIVLQIEDHVQHTHTGIADERIRRLQALLGSEVKPAFHKKLYRRILADRDIQSEPASTSLELGTAGQGATNIIRRYLRTTSQRYSRKIIQQTLRNALNDIFGPDGQFTEIEVNDHDETEDASIRDHCEVYIGEKNKGLVPLSQSGSGLKTVFLVLLNLIVVPDIEKKQPSDYVFAFEELENNLHPSLLRRLLAFLAKYITDHKTTLFLTTHSSTALDIFGDHPEAQIVHVEHDGKSAKSTTVPDHFSRVGVVAGLGARPSDLLQANGILWLEGPSDRIYLNRWIDIFSDGELQEGQHYQCAFYGGSVLARTEFVAPEDGVDDLVNLARINSNVVVVCDSDRTNSKDELKERVIRIQQEVGTMPNALVWVTQAKEIENYLQGNHLKDFCGLDDDISDPKIHQRFFPSQGRQSYMGKELGRKTIDKVKLAIAVAPSMTRENMSDRFDLKESVEAIVKKIRSWNN